MSAWNKYDMVKPVGKGAYGRVSIVRCKESGLKYVLKELPLDGKSDKEVLNARKEVRLLQTLRHPNIVEVVETLEDDGSLFIVMEYAEAGDLERCIQYAVKQDRAFSEDQVFQWVIQILLALRYMHSNHVLHRDLKTANVFITRSGVAKLGDFGFSKQLTNTLDVAQTLCGTPYYLPPEKFRQQPYNNKADLFAAGVIAYELMTFKKPWPAKSFKELRDKVLTMPHDPLDSYGYSTDLCRLTSALLAKSPAARPSISTILSWTFVRTELERLKQLYHVQSTKAKEDADRRRQSKALEDKQRRASMPPPDAATDNQNSHNNQNHGSSVPHSGVGGAQHMRMTPEMMKKFMASGGPPPKSAPPPTTTTPPNEGTPDEEEAEGRQVAALYQSMREQIEGAVATPHSDDNDNDDTVDGHCEDDPVALADAVGGRDVLARAVALYHSDRPFADVHGEVCALLGPGLVHYTAGIQRLAAAASGDTHNQ
eukprot:PhM_4_TR9646/c0_g1_i1/m.72743/K08857/NEK1_4_5; NIMA (never in mitosis gene a)-related kinase 1/4/5